MPFTTCIHKMDRAFALMHQGSKQELNDLYKTPFVLERLSVEEGYLSKKVLRWRRPRHIVSIN